jgi:mannosyltransferase OCH1-like enzyme
MINQILLLDDETNEADALVDSNKKLFNMFYPDLGYKIWKMQDIRSFLSSSFDSDVINAFDSLKPYAYKSDLARLCILYEIGGFYFDIHTKPASSFIPDKKIMAFRDIQKNSFTSWSVQTNVLFSQPGQKVFSDAISILLENVRNRYYGITALCPTGPTVMGKAFANFGATLDHLIGDFMELTPSFGIKNNASVLPDGKIFAFGKNLPGGDISMYGSNNYGKMWFDKNIYSGD